MKQTASERRQSVMESIIRDLKPNNYSDDHPIWKDLEQGLRTMSLKNLNILWTVVTCKREGE